MELRDLIFTPLVIVLVYLAAYILRPRITNEFTRRYFFPALTVRIIGALSVGFIYQFYYPGGDTFTYHKLGSRVLWEAFMKSPSIGIDLFFREKGVLGSYVYYSKLELFNDPASYTVTQIAFVFDLFTFSSYSATAVLFSVIGFLGSWLMFLAFFEMYPSLRNSIALSTLFIPSVIFWGSGLLKDTLTYASVGAALYSCHHLFIKKKYSYGKVVLLIVSFFLLYKIKIYILLTFVPSLILWVFFENLAHIRNKITRVFAAPAVTVIAFALSMFAILKAGEDNPKYSYSKLAKTAQVTAYDIRYWSGKGAGSGYTLGELDGTFGSMIALAPSAVVVSLFRPFIWEVNNPLMLISSIEATLLLLLLVFVLIRSNFFLLKSLTHPTVIFCLGFSLIFAFAVGVSTYNFGSLVRYKIPLLPFFMIALILIDDLSRKERIRKFSS
ncbi:MAG: hypothetical protein JST48_06855 [Bacteroidetes bacterium]|nr:hypothetical protein [Bacteroidota bacterium]